MFFHNYHKKLIQFCVKRILKSSMTQKDCLEKQDNGWFSCAVASISSRDQDAEERIYALPPSSQENQVITIRLGRATQIWSESKSALEQEHPNNFFDFRTHPSVFPRLWLAVPIVRGLFMPPRVLEGLLQDPCVGAPWVPAPPPLFLHELGALRHPAPLTLLYPTKF